MRLLAGSLLRQTDENCLTGGIIFPQILRSSKQRNVLSTRTRGPSDGGTELEFGGMTMKEVIAQALTQGLEMTREVIAVWKENWYMVAAIPGIMGIIGVIAALFNIQFSRLSPEKQYRHRLRRGHVKPKYLLRLGKPITDYPGKLVKGAVDFSPYGRFLPVTLVHEGDNPEFDVKLELTEPSDRWTFRPYEGIAAITGWNHERSPSVKTPRRSFVDLLERGAGVRIGAICINREKDGESEEHLSWRFTCLGETVGEGRSRIE